jgi:hypothetical protein
MMAMCPSCQQQLDAGAIACPHCGFLLKAHGHPGIPIHRSSGEEYLCETCVYHTDDSCNYPQRPQAKTCTLYTSPGDQKRFQQTRQKQKAVNLQWLWPVLVLLGLILVSVLLNLR